MFFFIVVINIWISLFIRLCNLCFLRNTLRKILRVATVQSPQVILIDASLILSRFNPCEILQLIHVVHQRHRLLPICLKPLVLPSSGHSSNSLVTGVVVFDCLSLSFATIASISTLCTVHSISISVIHGHGFLHKITIQNSIFPFQP